MEVPRVFIPLIPVFRRAFEALAALLEGVASDGGAVHYAAFEHMVALQLR